ncbi:MAG TPA: hypothetical protein PLB67_08515 [Candidatus Hydrogenedentes bacterium]|jgi:hypothetical protein|nr:hypothetical protein [Candidatus Hydrogenedentota bacterium]MDY0032608.1 hypothetical protein [FCB group bacterium]NLT60005.1 hypothetical protein [Candidatus Hydrogenedentota bacterium]HNZ16684.1 hypothetical protein [Candidatus Hydrogenedentota bacterium]HOH32237.1 hypothetical protein [Candidatus Hydrogenedentota bacterium]
MSGWSFDILTPKYMPWGAGTYKLRAGCWEIGLMCHLLNQFNNYHHMYEMHVAKDTGQDALARLAHGVETIPQGELSEETKKAIVTELNGLRRVFLKAHPHKKMRDLYTWPEAEAVDPHVIEGFGKIETLVAQDTGAQKDPATGGNRFSRPCAPCMPFFAVMKKEHPPVALKDIEEHINKVGAKKLEELYKTKKTQENKPMWEAVAKAKKNGIFSKAGDRTACLGSGFSTATRGKDPGNDLACVNGRCQAYPDAFCSTAEDGGCSVMSD